MSLWKEPFGARVRRVLGGEDTRPPANWPFPTWKGQPLHAIAEDGPPMPARRGPKRTMPVHNAPIPDDESPDHGRP